MRIVATALAALAALVFAASLHAQGVSVQASDSTVSVLVAQKGKRVTLRLRSGLELTGTVRDAFDRLVVLDGVGGREFFDVVVPVDAIELVQVRNRP